MARAATPAITALLAAGIPHEVLRYHHDPQNESFGEEAVNELASGVAGETGIAPAQIRDVAPNPADLVLLTNAVTADIGAA